MAQTKKLARFEAVPSDDGATLTIETEDGVSFELEASFEQLEIMADTLDDILTENDDATEVKDEQEA
jgi:hypothetical protein